VSAALRPRDRVIVGVSVALGLLAIFLPWTTVSGGCANTDVQRGFAETIDPVEWGWLYLLAFTGVLGSALVSGARGAWLLGASALLALVSTGVMAADLSEPFEAFRPRPGLPPVGMQCTFDPAAGWGLASIAVVLALVAAARRMGLGLGSKRLWGAIVAGVVGAAYSWLWVMFLVDAAVDAEANPGALLTTIGVVAVAASIGRISWSAVGGRAMASRALLTIGAFLAAGPLLLVALRAAHLARAGAAILADWNEPNGLLGPMVVGTIGLTGAILIVVGAAVSRRPRS